MERGQETEETFRHRWRYMSRTEIDAFVFALSVPYEVVGVTRKQGRLAFEPIDHPAEMVLDAPPRVHSPKKFLFPNWERLFRFRLGSRVQFERETAAPPRIIFGIHSCDLHAIRVLDDCLFDGDGDSTYRAKRRVTLLVGVECTPDAACFCSPMGTDRISDGFDLYIHRSGDGYLIESGSEAGEQLLVVHAPALLDRPEEAPLPLQPKTTALPLDHPVDRLGRMLDTAYDDPVWKELGERCLGCGACTLVCPTCYCFNVQDRLDTDMESGERVRTWDSCQLDSFTAVADRREQPRADQADRQRHRFFRKYHYLWEKYRRAACVGCGRCFRECLAKIDPREVLNQIGKEHEPVIQLPGPGDEYRPELAQIVSSERISPRDVLLKLALPRPVLFDPGMFVTLSVFGLGEAPFTIASTSENQLEIEVVVREVGSLTAAIHRLKSGDLIGVRGPFGSGFPVEEFEKKDLLLVAAGLGIITFRSLLYSILYRRASFGRILLLAGGRVQATLPFLTTLQQWRDQGVIDCRLVVDQGDHSWLGGIGGVHQLLRQVDLDPARTIALVSGTTQLYRETLSLIRGMGIGDDRLYVNLERRMKCGLGKCGSCQVNDLYVCECGPIFRFDKVRHLREAF